MDDNTLDTVLNEIAATQPAAHAGEGFRDAMWQRVGELTEAREMRRKTFLGVAVVVVSLTTGFGAAVTPAMAEPDSYTFLDGSELAPSSLLHVEP